MKNMSQNKAYINKFPHNLRYFNYLKNKIEDIFLKNNAEKMEVNFDY